LEDDQNTLRAFAFHKYSPETPIFLETIRPEAAYMEHDFTRYYHVLQSGAVCTNEFKQIFMATNCLYRGAGTLLINFLRGVNEQQTFDLPWHAQVNAESNLVWGWA
jgi:imidazole glycerol phosphate synthase subunit HisF